MKLVEPDEYAKCKECSRQFRCQDSVTAMGNRADHPLFRSEVVQPLVKAYGTQIYLAVCPTCVDDRWNGVLVAHESQRTELTDEEERYGW